MTWRHRPVSRRAFIGLGLGLWVILITFATLRARADGPVWGLQLAASPQGDPIVVVIDPLGSVWSRGVRTGDAVLTIDGLDARDFVGPDLSPAVREVVFRDPSGVVRVISPTEVSSSVLTLLTAGALLFAVLGALVYRWSVDAALGRLFLLLSGAFATTLLAAPASLLGHPWPGYLTGPAGILATASLFGVFLYFPRPLRHAAWAASVAVGVAAVLGVAQLYEPNLGSTSIAAVDTVTSMWVVLNLLGAVLILGSRTMRRADRQGLKPLLIGTAVGVGPYLMLSLLPRVLGQAPWLPPELAAICVAAIPISFAYSILHHHVFSLDALVRRALMRTAGAGIGVGVFFVGWQALQAAGLPNVEAALLAAVATVLAMPSISAWAAARVDAWLYKPMSSLRRGSQPLLADSLEHLGGAVALRLRQLLPIQWAAVIVHDGTTSMNSESSRMLGVDGQVPMWLDPHSTRDQSPTEASVAPIYHLETGVVLLLAGPRLDGARIDGIQHEAMQMLARGVSVTFEATLLRERAEGEAHFRNGLTDLARDLAAAATVRDVLRSLTTHAARLFNADSANMWRSGPDGGVAILDAPANALPTPEFLRDVIDAGQARGRERDWTVVTDNGTTLAFALDDGADEPAVCLVRRGRDQIRFGVLEERRAQELIEHTSGALRRAAEREVLEEQLRHRAFYDSLTGLPNRALFLDRIAHSIARADRLGYELAVLFIDLDRFKVINDSLGHSAGDRLLVEVGRRLRSCLRESDTLARLGGDEFTVMLEGPTAIGDAPQAAERILAALREPFILDGQDTYVSASIGIAGGEGVRESGRDLLREADIALYRAKAAGRRGYMVFEARMSNLPAEHLHLESDLHRAIERDELRVHYQPIFALADGRITGLEALVRWEHPEKGLVQPNDFIPLAEDTGLIVPIGKWVLDAACRQMVEWRVAFPGTEKVSISVNLSARQLQDAHLLQDVENAIYTSGLDPEYLQLEITESVVMQEPEQMVFKLNALKRLGIKLAVDDFGTGYSSLAYLKRFPIDVLKIDRAFVNGITHSGHDSAIVQTVVGLARALGLRTTAEGIEDRSQWALLAELGCDQGQGYLFSRPLRPEGIADMLGKAGGPRRIGAAA
jgi:diguanylate cyclase (GGDEF)-like protein